MLPADDGTLIVSNSSSRKAKDGPLVFMLFRASDSTGRMDEMLTFSCMLLFGDSSHPHVILLASMKTNIP